MGDGVGLQLSPLYRRSTATSTGSGVFSHWISTSVLPRRSSKRGGVGLTDLFASTVARREYRCEGCGHEFEAPDRERVQCPDCLGYRTTVPIPADPPE
jgi:DNA-directed RNA polymerase subunit RPC12/RpoP